MSVFMFAQLRSVTARKTRNAVRIIGGRWKRSVITFTAAEGLRPTPDRVRETVFNWLGQDLSGLVVLDAFAGTGAFTLEAASRGAARVLALDVNPVNVRAISEHVQRLGGAQIVQVRRADAMHVLGTYGAEFDLVFCDPPFALNLYPKLQALVPPVLKPGGYLYLEAPQKFETFGGLALRKHLRAGAVHAHLFSASEGGCRTYGENTGAGGHGQPSFSCAVVWSPPVR